MKLTINVTQNDIAKGVKGRPSACPVFLGVKRRCTGYLLVDGCSIVTTLYTKVADLPQEALNFIRIFDSGLGDALPFKFEIDVAPKWVKRRYL